MNDGAGGSGSQIHLQALQGIVRAINALTTAVFPVFTQSSIPFAGTTGGLTQDNSLFYWDDTNKYFGGNTAILSDKLSAVVSQAASHGVAPNVTGILTISTNPTTSAAGFAALKVGLQAPSSAGWFTNPVANAFVATYSVVDSFNSRGAALPGGIYGANLSAIVLSGHDSFASGCEIDINNSGTSVDDFCNASLSKNGLTIISGGSASPSNGLAIDTNSGATNGNYHNSGIRITRAARGIYLTQRGGDVAASFATAAIVDDSNSATSFFVSGGTHGTGIDLTGGTYSTYVINAPGLTVDPNGNVALGKSGTLATNATNGWAYIPSSVGAPTGTPGTSITGHVELQGDTTNNSLWAYQSSAWQQYLPASMVFMVGGFLHGVNFNSANTDNAITINLPAGVTRYRVNALMVSAPSTALSTASVGLFTSAGGSGTVIANTTLSSITATAESTSGNAQQIAGPGNESFTNTTLQVRVGSAEGSPATGNVHVFIQPLP